MTCLCSGCITGSRRNAGYKWRASRGSCRVSGPLMVIINHYSCLKCDCKCGPALAGQQSSQLNDFGSRTQQFGLHLAEESPANLRDWLSILSRNLAVNKIDMAVKFSDYNFKLQLQQQQQLGNCWVELSNDTFYWFLELMNGGQSLQLKYIRTW